MRPPTIRFTSITTKKDRWGRREEQMERNERRRRGRGANAGRERKKVPRQL